VKCSQIPIFLSYTHFPDLLLLLHLFHFLLTPMFLSLFMPYKSSLLTSPLAAISIHMDTGLICQPAPYSRRQEVVSPTLASERCPQSQPPSDLANVLARLGPDKYSHFGFDGSHFS